MDTDDVARRNSSQSSLRGSVRIFRFDRLNSPRVSLYNLGGEEFGDSIAASRPLPVASALHSFTLSALKRFVPKGPL